jgi:hypothetical protein
MNYLVILALVSILTVPPVFAADTPNAPVKKGNLMLAKKKDHSKPAEQPKKASKKSSKK